MLRINRKYLFLLNSLLSLVINLCLFKNEGYSLLGNSHYHISELVLKEIESENKYYLTKEQKQAFLSGSVLADIGRFCFDKKINVDSDSKEFILKLVNFAENSGELWFSYGAFIHYIQDVHTKNILEKLKNFEVPEKLENYKSYLKYGQVDRYFFDKYKSSIYFDNFTKYFKLDTLMEKKIEDASGLLKLGGMSVAAILRGHYVDIKPKHVKIYTKILERLYKKEYDLDVTDNEIYEQSANLVGASVLLGFLSEYLKKDSELDKENKIIKSEVKKLVKICKQELYELIENKNNL